MGRGVCGWPCASGPSVRGSISVNCTGASSSDTTHVAARASTNSMAGSGKRLPAHSMASSRRSRSGRRGGAAVSDLASSLVMVSVSEAVLGMIGMLTRPKRPDHGPAPQRFCKSKLHQGVAGRPLPSARVLPRSRSGRPRCATAHVGAAESVRRIASGRALGLRLIIRPMYGGRYLRRKRAGILLPLLGPECDARAVACQHASQKRAMTFPQPTGRSLPVGPHIA